MMVSPRKDARFSAMKHGATAAEDTLMGDRRRWERRYVAHLKANLKAALPDPSPQQELIIQRVCMKALRCVLAEREMLRIIALRTDTDKQAGAKALLYGDKVASLQDRYLAWSRSMLADLQVLGLERKARPVMDLQTYIASKERK